MIMFSKGIIKVKKHNYDKLVIMVVSYKWQVYQLSPFYHHDDAQLLLVQILTKTLI